MTSFMHFLGLFLGYTICSNILLALFLRFGFREKIDHFFLCLLSYGIGPLMTSLFFYASLMFFSGRGNFFYVVFISSVLIGMIFFSGRSVLELWRSNTDFFHELRDHMRIIPLSIRWVCLFFILLFSVQLLVYPIIDNDSANYLNQAEAIFEYKQTYQSAGSPIIIRGDDHILSDSSIQSGILGLVVFSDMLQGGGLVRDFLSFRFIVFYYYVLLLVFFLAIIRRISIEVGFAPSVTLAYGLIFFVFSWGISRAFIFGAKEIVIYFFALASIFVASLLLRKPIDIRQPHMSIMLGLLLGLGAFVNLHGIMIEVILLLVLLLLSKKSFLNRAKEVILIFLLSLPFGGFEFFIFFKFIVLIPVFNFLQKPLFIEGNGIAPVVDVVTVHQNLYQFHTVRDEYFKGKLQILTNPGSFGLYFWLYMGVLTGFFRDIMKNDLLKFLSLFIAFYYLIIIDPFRIINHPFSIVLTGSAKYAMLLVFLSMIPTSVFLPALVSWMSNFLSRHRGYFIFVGLSLFLMLLFFKNDVVAIGLGMLLSTIALFKEISFYEKAIVLLYDMFVFILLFFIASLSLSFFQKKTKWIRFFTHTFCVSLILIPFFATNVGKVPLFYTLTYASESDRFKLEQSLSEGDVFSVYFQARDILPRGTVLAVDYRELYIYDEYFSLRYSSDNPDIKYRISADCSGWKSIVSSGGVSLCERN